MRDQAEEREMSLPKGLFWNTSGGVMVFFNHVLSFLESAI